MYAMLHGENSDADLLLSALSLTRDQVGRYRDCWVTPEGDIAVYTRNGGGNRNCWHADDPKRGNEDCSGEAYEVEVDEIVELEPAEGEAKGYKPLNIYIGSRRMFATGKRVMETRHTCTEPESIKCGCAGCVIEYRLPRHPLYLHDCDDDFDSTYATVYFKAPDSIPDDYPRGDSGDERWARVLALLSEKARDR